MKLIKILFILIILFAPFQICFGQEKVIDNSCQIPFELKFFKDLETVGFMYVLMEPRYFKPQKLRTLFLCLSQKHPKFISLYITSFSSEENLKLAIKSRFDRRPNIHFPAGGDPPDRSEEDCKNLAKALDPCPIGYYRATYFRGPSEFFEYSPNPNKRNMVTVILRKKFLKRNVKSKVKTNE